MFIIRVDRINQVDFKKNLDIMKDLKEDFYRKTRRDFKSRIDLMKKMNPENAVNLFFEMCDFGLNNYIETEKQRYPNKSIKKIIREMHERQNNLKKMRRKKWK